jgi:hypothetical protein
MKKSFLLIIIIFTIIKVNAQIGFIQVIDSLDKRLTVDEIAKFGKADILFAKGDALIKTLDSLSNQIKDEENKSLQAAKRRDKRKARKSAKKIKEEAMAVIVKAAQIYSDAFKIKYLILNDKINYYYNDKVPDAGKAQILQHEAKEHHTTANAILKAIKESKDYPESALNLYEILKYRAVAMDKQMMALCYFINCLHLESNFDGILWISERLLSPEQKKTVEKIKKTIEPEKPVIVKKVENNDEPKFEIPTINETKIEKQDSVPQNIMTKKCDNLVFRVQIIAVSKPISNKRLMSYYPKGKTEKIEELKDKDGLWKYRVRYFTNYNEAKTFNDNTSVTDSFVIALCNGEQITLTEAIAISKGNK